jgi:3-oxoacyl-[acyl-carrier protein] reductase
MGEHTTAAGRDLRGDAALVTGAGRGIGRATALALAREGAAVVLSARSADELERVAGEIRDAGGRAVVLPMDLADPATPAALVAGARAALGKLTILVNNAAVGIYGRIEDATLEQWEATMGVNARAPFFLACEAIGPMRAAGGGAIVNVASVVGVKGYVNQGIYTAAKHAMMGWSKVLAQEVQADGIRVHTVCPGGVDTALARDARPDLDPSILIRPEAVAEVVVFLLRLGGGAVVDDVHIRRASGAPWF